MSRPLDRRGRREPSPAELAAELTKSLYEVLESMTGTLEIMLKTLHALEKRTVRNEKDALACMESIRDLLINLVDKLEKQAARPGRYVL